MASPNDSYHDLLARSLARIDELERRLEAAESTEPVAVVGLGCRFPGADSAEAFWDLLRDGVDTVGEIPADRWDVDEYFDERLGIPGKSYSRWGAFLDRADTFDAAFFGISPREAARMDPQQRLLLEVAWQALEDAAIPADKLAGSSTGVFVGMVGHDYAHLHDVRTSPADAFSATGIAHSVAAGRISYALGLQGPSLPVDTACSSSLVAVHLACRSLRERETDAALAGGVNLILIPDGDLFVTAGQMLARDGRCKTFDARADGYVRGEGCGVVVLKRLSDALADGDRVLALILGSAVNQDGRSNGLTAPSGLAQQEVIAAALRDAGVAPSAVDYVEAHGTGTSLGDPIELRALDAVYGADRPSERTLLVGSAKTNVGHLEGAAGVVGLAKAILSLQHETIPPHLHFHEPNPHVPWDELSLAVPTQAQAWARDPARPRIAGVSAFGVSGTNVHLVVAEAPPQQPLPATAVKRPVHLLTASAKSPAALVESARRLADDLSERGEVELANACHTLSTGRSHLHERLAIVASSAEEARERLQAFASGEPGAGTRQGSAPAQTPEVAFLFTGQGSQYPGMARELYETSPPFRAALDECAEALGEELDRPLLDVLYGDETALLDDTGYTQPALFAVEYALARLWLGWGVEPAAVAGHSIGEYVAACIAGVMSLPDALRLVAARGRLMAALPRDGAMAAILADEGRVAEALAGHADVAIAAVNAPQSVVLSGRATVVREILEALQRDGVESRPLTVSHAFHSPLMEPMLDAFEEIVRGVELQPPSIPLVSNLTGAVVSDEVTRPEYWRRHVREPVRFGESVAALEAAGCSAYVEIGPAPVLLGLARRTVTRADAVWAASLRRDGGDWEQLLESLGALYVAGVDVDWQSFDSPYARRRIALPTYPFQRERFWLDEQDTAPTSAPATPAPSRSLLGARLHSPLATAVWETRLDPEANELLAGHRVAGIPVLPGTAYLELTCAGAESLTGSRPAGLAEVEISAALAVPDGEQRVLQLAIDLDQSPGRFRVFSAPAGEADPQWTLHARGTFLPDEPDARRLDLDELRGRVLEEVDVESVYAQMRAVGVTHGEPFRGLERVWRVDGEALGRLRLPGGQVDGATLHPVLLDSALQLIGPALPGHGDERDQDQVYLPTGFERIEVAAPLPDRLWAHAALTSEPDGHVLRARLTLLDDDGRVLATVEGAELRRSSVAALEKIVRGSRPDPLFELVWEAAPLGGGLRDVTGQWLLLADRKGIAEELATIVSAAGGTCTLVDPGSVAQLKEVVEGTAGDLRGVVHLWGVGDDLSAEDALRLGPQALLHVVQALAPGAGQAPELWVVTAGAQAQTSGDRPSPWLATQWGLARVAARERKDLAVARVDLDPAAAGRAGSTALGAEILRADGEVDIAWRAGERYAARLVRNAKLGAGPGQPPLRLRGDATYLVTGGLGALGLVASRRLAELGAGTLVLVGRRAPDDAAHEAIAELERAGARVVAVPADIANGDEVAALLERIRSELPPLRGVVHSAGVLDDGAIANQRWERFEQVFGPKVRGAWHLHEQTREDDLDLFVVFSSVSSVIGPPGQANYAAANAFLDALAALRRAEGLPGLSIAWGPWSVGLASSLADRIRDAGGDVIGPDAGADLFGRMLAAGTTGTAYVIPGDVDGLYAADNPRLFERVASRRPVGEERRPDEAPELRATLEASPDADVRAMLVEHVRNEVAAVLSLGSGASVPADRPLTDLGLDSLTALELVNRLQRDAGIELPGSLAIEHPTPAAVAEEIGRRLRLAASGVPPSPAVAPVTPPAEPEQAREPAPAVQSDRHRALLRAQLAEEGGMSRERDIPRRPDAAQAPLSSQQLRMWLLHQMDPAGTAYNLHGALRISGPLEHAAFERALGEVVRRHEMLRTRFVARDGQPYQLVESAVPVEIPLIDLTSSSADEQDERIHELVSEEARRPFDLTSAPLLRAIMLRLADDEHVLSLSMHHIVSDGWSMRVLSSELAAAYEAYVAGASPDLPALPVQYADYAVWQQSRADRYAESLGYWRERLGGELPRCELRSDRPRPEVKGFRGARVTLELDDALVRGLTELAGSEGATLYMALLAGLKGLLARHTGLGDIVVGSPVAGRTRRELEGLIGFFVNTVVLRSAVTTDLSFREFLRRVRETTLGAFAHQELPFEQLLDELHVERDLARTPLFSIFFNMLSFPEAFGKVAGLTVEPLEGEDGARFDLTVYAARDEAATSLHAVYDVELFERARIEHLLDQLRHLLEQAVSAPDLPLAAHSLLTDLARPSLPDAAAPAALPPAEERLEELVERQVARVPDRVAVSDELGELTYRELWAESGRVASALLAAGLESEEVVALHLPRGRTLVAGMLGVLRAGGAFAILDPAQPEDRLAAQVDAAGIRGWIDTTDSTPPARVREALDRAKLRAELTLPLAAAAGDVVAPQRRGAEALAYVAFTSGTTGEPRAIDGEHAPVSHFLRWQREAFGLSDEDRFTLLSGLGHDPLLRDVLAPLALGATLCVPSTAELQSPVLLLEWLERSRVTVSHLTPSLLTALAEAANEGGELLELRLVFVGGEALDLEDVAGLERIAPSVTCVNAYGATETPQIVSALVVESDGARGPVPLGPGVAGAELLVLTDAGQVAGVGEIGEICVRTPHLARGYRGDTELTSARFSTNPLRDDPTDRLYRTGDLGAYLPEGTVEYLGRRDRQVKVRGYRVQLEEIERTLERHERVEEAAVVLDPRSEDPRSPRLVAYAAGTDLDPAELMGLLRRTLPEYMLPRTVECLDDLPRTSRGKIDLEALPAPLDLVEPDVHYEEPRTPLETELAEIWRELLGGARVGRHTDFFAAGGHSLLAMRLVARLSSRLGIEVSLKQVFTTPTLAGLAAALEASSAPQPLEARRRRERPTLVRRPSDGVPQPLSYAQQRLYFLDQLEPGRTTYNLPVAVRLSGPLDVGALERALAEVVRRHEALRTTIVLVEREPRQLVADELFALGREDLRGLEESEREEALQRLVHEEAGRRFDLARDLKLRATLVDLDADEHALLLTMHHIASDGWSFGILQRELAILYEAYTAGTTPALDELPVQYADYARWQREWLEAGELETQLAYWRGTLADVPPLDLPTNWPRPAVRSTAGAVTRVQLDAGLVDDLRELARREEATLFMVLLAGLQAVLSRLSGQTDVTVGSPIAGRARPELEHLIGFFVNTLVFRADLSSSPTFREFLGRMRDTCIAAYDHQDVPFEKLVEVLQPPRALDRTPFFQVLLALQNLPQAGIGSGELTMSALPTHAGSAQYDLTLTLAEDGPALRGKLEYSTDLFTARAAAAIFRLLRTLLAEACRDPDRRIDDLPLLDDQELRTILEEWNSTAADYSSDRTLVELVAEQARTAPDAVAVVADGETLTYRELIERADRYAGRLGSLGIGRGDLVGLLATRTAEAVAALLGIMRAGAAFVPLDPAFPDDRLAFMLEDSGARALIAEEALLGQVPAPGLPLVLLDASLEQVGPVSAPAETARPDDLAYVIYTSGSTGKPKGVQIEHRSVVNFLESMRKEPGLSSDDVLVSVTTFSFDISILEVFLPLVTGARVVLASRDDVLDGARLTALLESTGATVMQATPTGWRVLIESGWQGNAGLKMLCGGEAMPRDLASRLLELGGELWNMYGPTETTIWSTTRRITSADGPLPIGRPIANTQVYVLDPNGRPQPAGVAGELHIGGDGVARGYLGRLELTAERFVPNPFRPGRLYRTGDLARFLASGELEHLGRLDFQVKLRGFRIELGEIEAALAAHDSVREAVVILREDVAGEPGLVAYVVGEPAREPETDELRAFLRAALPEYMIPSVIVRLDSLPLTPNRKIDRKALPAPESRRNGSGGETVEPSTPLERVVANALGGALRVDRVGANESFFDLGGHSLLALQVVARLEEDLDVPVPLPSLFRYPTPASLAAFLADDPDHGRRATRTAELLLEISGLSDEEVEALLAEPRASERG